MEFLNFGRTKLLGERFLFWNRKIYKGLQFCCVMIEERLENIEIENKSNCIGTAFYLAGLVETDKIILTSEGYEFVKNLREVRVPQKKCIATWQAKVDGEIMIVHAGIINDDAPLAILNRREGKFMEEDYWGVNKVYFHKGVSTKFYALDNVFSK